MSTILSNDFRLAGALVSFSMILPACGDDDEAAPQEQSIVDIASADANFSIRGH